MVNAKVNAARSGQPPRVAKAKKEAQKKAMAEKKASCGDCGYRAITNSCKTCCDFPAAQKRRQEFPRQLSDDRCADDRRRPVPAVHRTSAVQAAALSSCPIQRATNVVRAARDWAHARAAATCWHPPRRPPNPRLPLSIRIPPSSDIINIVMHALQ